MSKVASAASTMGVNEQQLAAQLSTVISVTRQAPETIGTSFKTVYARIADIKAGIAEDGTTLGRYSGKMAEMGINVLDANNNLRDMGQVMEEIGHKWNTLTRQQQVYLTQTMAGQRQYSRLLALFDNFDQYEKALKTAQNAQGTLQEQQDTYMDSTQAHLRQLKAAVESIFQAFADTDAINGLIDGLTVLAKLAGNFVNSIGGGIGILKGLGAIGITVFSEQIAKGLNTTINNFELMEQKAQKIRSSIALIQENRKNNLGDDYTQSFLGKKQDMLELAPKMSNQQIQTFQNLIGKLDELSTKESELSTQSEKMQEVLQQARKVVEQSSEDWETLKEILTNTADSNELVYYVEKVKESLLQSQEGLKTFSTQWERITNLLQKDNLSSQEIEQLKQRIIKLKNEIQEGINLDNIPLKARGAIQKLQQEFAKIDDDIPGKEIVNKFTKIFSEVQLTVSEQIEVIKTLIGDISPEKIEKIRTELVRTQGQAKNTQNKIGKFFDNIKRQNNIENFSKIIGSIGQIAFGIQQIQNLGSIWKNSEIDQGQKITQTITNLTMTLPTLIFGIKEASTALAGLFGVSAGPFGIAIAAITAGVAAFSAFEGAAKQAREQYKKTQEEIIDKSDKILQQSENNKNLITSLEELRKKQQENNVTRAQSLQTIEDLINQYDLEGQAAERLRGNYNNLEKAIHDVRIENAKAAAQAAKEKITSIQNLFELDENASLKNKNDTVSILLDSEKSDQIKKYYKNSNFLNSQTKVRPNRKGIMNSGIEDQEYTIQTLQFGNSIKEWNQMYQQIQKWKSDIQNDQTISENVKRNSPFYNFLVQFTEKYGQSIKSVKEAQQELLKNQIVTLDFDFGDISSLEQYSNTFDELVNKIQEISGKKRDQSEQLARDYISQYFGEVYTKYDETSKYIDTLEKKFGDFPKKLKKDIQNLKDDQLSELFELGPASVTSYQQLQTILKNISNQDFKNVEGLKEDPSSLLDAASETYNVYKNIQDQVKQGKTISKKEYQDYIEVEPQLAQFFTTMANGSRKMVGNAEQFKKVIESIEFSGFYDTINGVVDKLGQLQQLQELVNNKKFNYDDLTKNAFRYSKNSFDSIGQSTVDYDKVQQQLDYLNATTDVGTELDKKIQIWQNMINEHQDLSYKVLSQITDAVNQAGDQTDNLKQKLEQTSRVGAEAAKQLHDALFPTDEDIDPGALNNLSERLMQLATTSEQLDDKLKNNKENAEQIAEALLRYDDAIKTTVDNYEQWIQALKSGSLADQANIMEDLRDTYADFLDITGESLSENFLADAHNLELMKAALDGSKEAYNELAKSAAVNVIQVTFGLNTDQAIQKYNEFQQEIQSYELANGGTIADLKIGVDIDDQKFIRKLENIINETGMTAQQAEALLKQSFGIAADVIPDTEIKEQQVQTENQYWVPATYRVTPAVKTGGQQYQGTWSSMQLLEKPHWEPVKAKQKIPNINGKLHITRASKAADGGKSGGSYKFQNSSQGGGSLGTKRRQDQAEKKRKQEEKKRKQEEAARKKAEREAQAARKKAEKEIKDNTDTSTKETIDSLEDERDIYHDINIQIQKINRNLDRTQKQQDRLYGKQLLNNLNKQTKILEQQKSLLRSKLALQKQDLMNQKSILAGLGASFDQYGNISNYMSVLGTKQNYINSLIAQYNSLINTFNASTDKTFKEDLSNRIDMLNDQIQNAQDDLKLTQQKIQQYDSLRESIQDVKDQIEEKVQKQFEINMQKFRMQVEIRLEMGQAERDWNEFKRNVLQHTDLIKDTDFSRIFKDAKKDFADLTSYFNVRGTQGSLETLTKQLTNTRKEIDKINRGGKSAIYGDNKKQAMEDLQKDLKQLMQQLQDVQAAIDAIDQAYLDTIDDVKSHFDEQIESYEFISDMLEHDMDLITLIYGESNYNSMNKYYETLNKNQLKQLDSLKKQEDFWEKQYNQARKAKDKKAMQEYLANWKDTTKKINELIETSIQTLKDKLSNAINKIFNDLSNRLTDGRGIHYVSLEWDLLNKNADQYLDTVNAAYGVQNVQSEFKKVLNDTKNLKHQKQLKKVMDEQLENLRQKEKLTQYDIDRALKMLQIEKTRIALEQAQSAKTSMRLKRDTQGNYAYQFTSDKENIFDAQQNYDNAKQDLYNFDLEQRKKDLDEFLQAYQQMIDKIQQIRNDDTLSAKEKAQEEKLIRQEYGEYINSLAQQISTDNLNLTESTFIAINDEYDKSGQRFEDMIGKNIQNFEDMTQRQKQLMMSQIVPNWDNSVQQMIDKMVEQGGFFPATKQAFDELHEKTRDYEDQLDRLADTAGIDLQSIVQGTDESVDAFENLIWTTDDLISTMERELDTVRDLRDAARDLIQEYNGVYSAALNAVSAIQSYIQAQQAAAAAAASQYSDPNAYGDVSGGYSIGGDYGGGGGGGYYDSGANSGYGGSGYDYNTLVEGIAGNIWIYGKKYWGNNPKRHRLLKQKFGGSEGESLYQAVQDKFNSGYGYSYNPPNSWSYYDKFKPSAFDTGGYTGSWGDNEGRMALLHKKELVLNAADTENLLDSVKILRTVVNNLGGNIANKLSNINLGMTNMTNNPNNIPIDQKVHIDANFPNVNTKKQIEDAFSDLMNIAAQKILKN